MDSVTINEQFGSRTGNSQVNNCTSNFCLNRVIGNDNTQTNNCVVGDPCINRASGNDNSQNIHCTGLFGQCADNSAVGDNNVQNMECKVDFISICENSAWGDEYIWLRK